jgi:putative transcriptional regulator
MVPAPGRFLVARRDLEGPFFPRTVIYLLQHDAEGTLGLVVNRPIGYQAADLLPELEGTRVGSYPVFNGGPVGAHIMIMLLKDIADTDPALEVIDGIYASSDAELLERMVAKEKPASELRLFIGHAGWLPGQLERELRENSWFVTDGDPAAVFSGDVLELWRRLIERLDPPGIMVLHQPWNHRGGS